MGVDSRELFRHVSAEKSAMYRTIMDMFTAAKRQFRLHLRPDEVLAEAAWTSTPPKVEEIQLALAQLAAWGNLESQPDTARVASISDFYRARFLYRLSEGGDAVESALAAFTQALKRRAELQTVALEDISSRLQSLRGTWIGRAGSGGVMGRRADASHAEASTLHCRRRRRELAAGRPCQRVLEACLSS